jgi:hypothetical protein
LLLARDIARVKPPPFSLQQDCGPQRVAQEAQHEQMLQPQHKIFPEKEFAHRYRDPQAIRAKARPAWFATCIALSRQWRAAATTTLRASCCHNGTTLERLGLGVIETSVFACDFGDLPQWPSDHRQWLRSERSCCFFPQHIVEGSRIRAGAHRHQ